MSPKLTATRPRTGSMLNRLPPYSGIIASISVTSAPAPTRAIARLEPMNPRPPVTSTRIPRNASRSKSSGTAHLLHGVGHRRRGLLDLPGGHPDVQRQRQDFVGRPLGGRQGA